MSLEKSGSYWGTNAGTPFQQDSLFLFAGPDHRCFYGAVLQLLVSQYQDQCLVDIHTAENRKQAARVPAPGTKRCLWWRRIETQGPRTSSAFLERGMKKRS